MACKTQSAVALQQYAKREIIMRNTILTVLGASLLALTVQSASAAEHHHGQKAVRPATSAQFRNSNAYAAPAYETAQPDWSRYNGGMSAPAGR
jgi:hypothetical protein